MASRLTPGAGAPGKSPARLGDLASPAEAGFAKAGAEASLRRSLAERTTGLRPAQRQELFRGLTNGECEALLYDWKFWARPSQLPPAGNWFCWLVLAGRGFGKTRMGVEWVRAQVEGESPLKAPKGAPSRIALVSQTFADSRDVMVEGESGFHALCHPAFRPRFEASRRRLVWPNGIKATLYSSEEPDQLRGPQHHIAWGDELGKWRNAKETWTNVLLGLRLGARPRVMATTTPRPIALIRELAADAGTAITRGTTFENAANLSHAFLGYIKRLYEGTRLGRQEIYGEVLEDVEGALWTRKMLEESRLRETPPLVRVVVAVDPPASHGEGADECGIIVAGRDAMGHGHVLADRSGARLTPHQWGLRAVRAYREFSADRLVAETNNGGDLVEAVIRQIAPAISYRAVRASRGKITRAEPVAALYERGLVHHAGYFRELEDQLCTYTGTAGEPSPDRMDALVWALTDLLLKGEAEPRIRAF